jgi:hypothetical protein
MIRHNDMTTWHRHNDMTDCHTGRRKRWNSRGKRGVEVLTGGKAKAKTLETLEGNDGAVG